MKHWEGNVFVWKSQLKGEKKIWDAWEWRRCGDRVGGYIDIRMITWNILNYGDRRVFCGRGGIPPLRCREHWWREFIRSLIWFAVSSKVIWPVSTGKLFLNTDFFFIIKALSLINGVNISISYCFIEKFWEISGVHSQALGIQNFNIRSFFILFTFCTIILS